jgi:UDP-N-acetylmuramate--alanine ligase
MKWDVTALWRIVENYNSNLIGDGKTVTVVEAMNLIVPFAFASQYCLYHFDGCDHLDIYGTSDAIESF